MGNAVNISAFIQFSGRVGGLKKSQRALDEILESENGNARTQKCDTRGIMDSDVFAGLADC